MHAMGAAVATLLTIMLTLVTMVVAPPKKTVKEPTEDEIKAAIMTEIKAKKAKLFPPEVKVYAMARDAGGYAKRQSFGGFNVLQADDSVEQVFDTFTDVMPHLPGCKGEFTFNTQNPKTVACSEGCWEKFNHIMSKLAGHHYVSCEAIATALGMSSSVCG